MKQLTKQQKIRIDELLMKAKQNTLTNGEKVELSVLLGGKPTSTKPNLRVVK